MALTLCALLLGQRAADAADGVTGLSYTVEIRDVEDSALRDALSAASALVALRDRPVPDILRLRRRADADMAKLRDVLRARGYYVGDVSYRIENFSPDKAVVLVDVRPGPLYRLQSYRVLTAGEDRQPLDVSPKALNVEIGSPAEAEPIRQSETRLLAELGRRAFPLAAIRDRRVVVDHATRGMQVEIFVAPGPRARFGATRIEGLDDVDAAFVHRQIVWREGEPFDTDALARTRTRLRETGLFSSISVSHASRVEADGTLPVTVRVGERLPRSVGAGASYSTTDGILGKVFWEHRNVFGEGERLRLRAEGGTIRYGLFGDLRIPDVYRRDQDLVFDAHLSDERPDGYRSREIGATGRIERRFGRIYSGSAGIGLERADIEDTGLNRVFSLLSLPLSLKRDSSDNLLDPSRGNRALLGITPYVGILDTDTNFVVARLSDSVYASLVPDRTLIAAGWFRIGSIFGESTAAIPPTKRLYAGGGGSVRGYDLNSIGPLDVENDPFGGRSSTEFGLELRWRAFESIGFVGFVEAGGVYDTSLPKWGKDLQWGTGLGVRYYSAIGPIRLDFAVPLNRRNQVDDAFAILVSVGQAF